LGRADVRGAGCCCAQLRFSRVLIRTALVGRRLCAPRWARIRATRWRRTTRMGVANSTRRRRANRFELSEYKVKPQNKKYSAFPKSQIRCITDAVSRPQEGRFAIVTNVGQGMRWTFWRQAGFLAGRNRQGVRRSRVVLTPRCWRQVLGKLTLLGDDGDNKPAHRGATVSR
jgi:hypothetical protein